MKLGELTKHINEVLKTQLSPLGFKKDGYGYTLNENGFTKKIVLSSVNRDNSFPTSFAIWIGFLGVDKILLTATENEVELKKAKNGGQIFIRQQELFEQGRYPNKDYDIYTLEEADQAIKEVLNYFLNSVIPEQDQNKNIKILENKINFKDGFANDRFLSNRLKYGLILAKLVNNPEYENLKQKYRELLKDWSDWDRKELEKVISFLDSQSHEKLLKIAESPN